MAWNERRYAGELPSGRLGGLPVATLTIVGVTVAVSVLLWGFTGGVYSAGSLKATAWGSISAGSLLKFELWRLVTCLVLHGNTSHLVGNMIVLLIVGLFFLESMVGAKALLKMYVGFGIAASLTVLLKPILTPLSAEADSIGASGAIMGLIAFSGSRYPRIRIFLLGLVSVPAWSCAAFFVAIDVLYLFGGDSPGTDHVVHLGGASAGFFLGFFWPEVQVRWESSQVRIRSVRQFKQQEKDTEYRAELDRILQKINDEGGMHRLTERERRFLLQQSDRLKGRRG